MNSIKLLYFTFFKNQSIALIVLGVLCLTVLAIEPLLRVGFTTNDDLENYLYFSQNSLSWSHVLRNIQTTGFRPLHLLFISIPYIYDSFAWFKFVQIFVLLLSITSLSVLIGLLARNKYVGLLLYVLLLGLMQNSWGHNILTSYPFIFHMCLSLMFIAIILFYHWLQTKKIIFFWVSLTCYICPVLVTEVHIFYSVLFPIIVLIHSKRSVSLQQLQTTYKKEYVYSSLYILCAILFVITYYWLKNIYGENYDGTTVNISSLQGILAVLKQYSISSFPSYVYFQLDALLPHMSHRRDFLYANELGIASLLNALTLKWYCIALINAIFTYCLLGKLSNNLKLYIVLFLVGVIFVFMPNVLLAITSKYQAWVANGDINYIYTYR